MRLLFASDDEQTRPVLREAELPRIKDPPSDVGKPSLMNRSKRALELFACSHPQQVRDVLSYKSGGLTLPSDSEQLEKQP